MEKKKRKNKKVSKSSDPNNHSPATPPFRKVSYRDVLPLKLCPMCVKHQGNTSCKRVCVCMQVGLNALTFHWIAGVSCHDNTETSTMHNMCVCMSMPLGSNSLKLKTAACSIHPSSLTKIWTWVIEFRQEPEWNTCNQGRAGVWVMSAPGSLALVCRPLTKTLLAEKPFTASLKLKAHQKWKLSLIPIFVQPTNPTNQVVHSQTFPYMRKAVRI